MAKLLTEVAEEVVLSSPTAMMASLSSAKSVLSSARSAISLLSSGTPAATMANGQLKKIILAKKESSHDSFIDFIGGASNPLIRFMGKSPAVNSVLTMIDKGVESGLVTDDMLLEIVDEPTALLEIFEELSSLI